MKYNFIDLFSGAGGLSEGFLKSGFNSLCHLDFDYYSTKTVEKRLEHYGYKPNNDNVILSDITEKDVLSRISNCVGKEKVNIIVGGPPCQSFSSLGKAKDKHSMKKDKRNYLFESYIKILEHFSPEIFVFENVPGILSQKVNNNKVIDLVTKGLSKKYKLIDSHQKMVLNSCDYGVPQVRKRVIIIGVRKDLEIDADLIYDNIIKTHFNPKSSIEEKKDKKKYVTVKDSIQDLPSIMPNEGDDKVEHKIDKWNDYLLKIRHKKYKYITHHVSRNHNEIDRERYKLMSKHELKFVDLLNKYPHLSHKKRRVFNNSYVVQRWNYPSNTIIAHLYKDGNQFIHPDYRQERTLTPREAARLQSFPDDFVFCGPRTEIYKQIGNAVPPIMAESIALAIKKTLNKLKNV